MNLKSVSIQKILVPLCIIGGSALAFRAYGWPGIAAVVTVLMFGMLLHFSRMMTILKRTSNRPIGYVDSAVMLNAKLKSGVTLLHVVAMTKALGELKSVKDQQPELYRWTDGTESHVTCEFLGGKLVKWAMVRPAQAEDATPQANANDETNDDIKAAAPPPLPNQISQ